MYESRCAKSSTQLIWSLPLSIIKDVCDALIAIRRLRSEIDKLLGSDRGLCLVVAIETALADERYEVRQQTFCKSVDAGPTLGCNPSAPKRTTAVSRGRIICAVCICASLWCCGTGRRCTYHGAYKWQPSLIMSNLFCHKRP